MECSSNLSRVTRAVAAVLTDACTVNSAWNLEHSPSDLFSCFECQEVPAISVAEYMRQVERVAGPAYWPVCLILIDELCRINKVPVGANNVHRLVITAYALALKTAVDGTGLPPLVAAAGGIAVDDLVEMEAAFLQLIDWRVNVGAAAHAKVVASLRVIQSTARGAATRSPDGPITLIPAAVVPREDRFDLLAPVKALTRADFAKSQSSGSPCSPGAQSTGSGIKSASAPVLPFAPSPPKGDRSGSKAPRRETVPCARPESAESRRSAGKRMETAIGYARCCEQE